MTTTDADETILNPEEIAFLLRPAPTGRLTDLAAARIVAAPEIKSKLQHIARQYAAALKKCCAARLTLFFRVPAIRCFSVFRHPFYARRQRRNHLSPVKRRRGRSGCRRPGTAENCTRFSIGGISYNLLYRCILLLNRIIGDQFPHLRSPKQTAFLRFCPPLPQTIVISTIQCFLQLGHSRPCG